MTSHWKLKTISLVRICLSLVHSLGENDGSILFDMKDGIQNQLNLGHPNHKLLHEFYVSIAQHLHKIKMTGIPSIMDTILQWDPQPNITIRYGGLTGKLFEDESKEYIPRIFWYIRVLMWIKSL